MTTSNFDSLDSSENSIVHVLLMRLRTIWESIKMNGNIFLMRIGAYETFDKVAQQSARHPYLALIISVTMAAIMLPFLIMLGFLLLTVLLTFTGFILVEGTLITIVSVLLFGCLASVILLFIFLGGLTLASYLGFMHVFDLYNGANKTAMKNFLKKENIKKT